MKARKLTLTGEPDDGARLDDFCERLAAREFEAGARLRELEVALAADRSRDTVTIDRDSTGRGCQISWERWADMADDATMEKTAPMISAIVVSCAVSR